MYKAVIFDLDGTLLDTSRDIQKVLNYTLARFGLPTLSLEKTLEYVGNGAARLVERAIPKERSELFDSVYADYRAHFAACDNKLTTLYDGEADVLCALKRAGLKLGLVTNKPQDATERVYNMYLSPFGFDFVRGNTGEYPFKPDPALTLFAAESMGVKPGECLFVGDGEPDVATAKNAGMNGVSVLWGFRTKKQLEAAGATRFVKNYDELYKLIVISR